MYTVHLVISDLQKYCMYGSLKMCLKNKQTKQTDKLLHKWHNTPNQ